MVNGHNQSINIRFITANTTADTAATEVRLLSVRVWITYQCCIRSIQALVEQPVVLTKNKQNAK